MSKPIYSATIEETAGLLTKRELFALAAMQGILAKRTVNKTEDFLDVAIDALHMADTMLDEIEGAAERKPK